MGTTLLVLTLLSHHFGYARHFNEVNPGLGLETSIGRGYHLAAGGYDNSQSDFSAYALVGRGRLWGRVGFGVDFGMATGYDLPVLPLVAPYGLFQVASRATLKVSLLPTSRPILGLQLCVKGR